MQRTVLSKLFPRNMNLVTARTSLKLQIQLRKEQQPCDRCDDSERTPSRRREGSKGLERDGVCVEVEKRKFVIYMGIETDKFLFPSNKNCTGSRNGNEELMRPQVSGSVCNSEVLRRRSIMIAVQYSICTRKIAWR